MPRAREGGLTLVEIMVSVLLVAIAAAFTFSIQMRATSAFRDQSSVAELQQTVRAAQDFIGNDLRTAGFMAAQIHDPLSANPLTPITFDDNPSGDGTDVLYVQYADTSAVAHIQEVGPSYTTTQTHVDNSTGFSPGDTVLAVHARDPQLGEGCLMTIATITGAAPNLFFTHSAGNPQCAPLAGVWTDGYTEFTKVVLRAYRIKPGDPRGVLQMSPSGARVANDWQDMALGVVDLQVSLRVYEPGGVTDYDGDGDPLHNWYSGSQAKTVLQNTANLPLMAAVTLVGKTTKEVSNPGVDQTPDILVQSAPADYNPVGNHPGTVLPVTDTTSPFFGSYVYRSYTQTVDLRNVGMGL